MRLSWIIWVGRRHYRKHLYKGEQEITSRSGPKVETQREDAALLSLKREEIGHDPRNARSKALDPGKDKEMDSFLDPPAEISLWQHLSFSPIKLISYFWTLEMCTRINFCF